MKKYTPAFIIAFSLGLLSFSCSGGQDIITPMATSTIQKQSTLTQIPSNPTPVPTPEPNKISDETNGLITTLGEAVNKQGWWTAIPAFSPDGKMIVLVSESVRLWNTDSYELLYELEKPYSNCHTKNVVFSSDGKLLATSIYCIADSKATGHVLIWNTESGILMHDWEQRFSKNTSKDDGIINSYPATGIAFLPNSSEVAYANGNTIEIKDALGNSNTVVFELGDEMVASDIGISDDGKELFAFMDFSYFKPTGKAGQKYALQVWELDSKSIKEEIYFPEPDNTGFFIGHFDVEMKLIDKRLLNTNYVNKTFSVTNLETGKVENLSYNGDARVFASHDSSYVVYLPKLNGFNCKNQTIELWSTEVNQSLFILKTSNEDFGKEWCFGPYSIAFSPNNAVLAIAHEERLSLWDINEFTKPNGSTIP